jgi:AcrR family transcriptional regulator
MAEGTKADGRKEAGERTRRRLLEAARKLLAERDEEAVALRDITASAGANVASVSYHFGSKDALCRAAILDAVDTVVEAQAAELRGLGDDAGVDEIAAALARPVVGAIGGTSENRCVLRIVARAVTDPPPGMREPIAAMTARAYAELLPALRRAVPGVSDDELCFRIESVGSIIHRVASGSMGLGLEARSDADVERLLVPVIAGALAGGARVAVPPVVAV